MTRYIFILVLLFGFNQVVIYCQQPDYIRGKVIDSKTSEPVPFATVRLKNSLVGVISNAEGDFRILNNPEFQSDSLIVSSIGFHRLSLAFSKLKLSEMNNLNLVPNIYSLNEVKVTARKKRLSSEIIITRAIRDIKVNYPDKPFSGISYYRDYQKKDQNYINLNEAIIQTLDNGFSTESLSNKYRMLDFRKNMDFPRMSISPYYDTISSRDNPNKIIPRAKIGDQNGNELFILMVHDPIRNYKTRSFSFIEIFSENFLFNHLFSIPILVYDNNLLLYRIDFKGKTKLTGNSIRVSGSIYIQPKDYSIHKLQYSCFYLKAANEEKEMYNVDIEYGYENDVNSLMRLKYISFNNIFNILDTDDNDCFRILDTYWEPVDLSKSTIVVEFNNKIDPESANKIENYEIKIKGKKAKINKLIVKGNMLMIRLLDENIQGYKDSSLVSIKNLQDINGNILNKRKVIEVNQYRELFVQEYNKPLEFQNNCFIQAAPLEKNCISTSNDSGRFWMNTPLKAAEKQQDSQER